MVGLVQLIENVLKWGLIFDHVRLLPINSVFIALLEAIFVLLEFC